MTFHSGIGIPVVRSLAILGLSAASASADPLTIYSSRAQWNAAAPGATVLTFEGTAELSTAHGTRAVFGGVTFTGAELFTNAPALDYDSPHHQSTYLEWQNPPLLNVSLPGPVHAIGFDYGTFYGEIHTLQLVLPWREIVRLRTGAFSNRFFGLVSARPLSGFALNDVSGNFPTLDDFSFASPAPIPEPGSLLLVGTGLVWSVRRLRGRSRRRGPGRDLRDDHIGPAVADR